MGYTIKGKLNQQDCSVIVFKLQHLKVILESLKSKGVSDIQVLATKPTEIEQLRVAMEQLGLNEQLDLIESFKYYIKNVL